MKRYFLFLGIGLILIVLVGLLIFQSKTKTVDSGQIKLAATLYPLYDMVRNIGGEKVEAKFIVPPGASEHFFEFSPQDLAELKDVKLIFAIGQGLDNWVTQARNAVGEVPIVIVDQGIKLRAPQMIEEGEKAGFYDPHYWLHLGNALEIIETIKNELIKIDPSEAAYYQANTEKYLNELRVKRDELKELFATVEKKPILTFHDAWFYFAEDFGLEIAGTFEPAGAEEPTPQYLNELEKVVKEKNIKVIFSEPQLSSQAFKQFLEDNDLTLAELDPLGGVSGRETYLELLEFNAQSVVAAMKKN